MIIWINGAFGAGKTQTAHELCRRIPGSILYDPEEIGSFIARRVPREIAEKDFQDYEMWRDFNYAMLRRLHTGSDRIIVVPMTIVNLRYFDEIVGRLRRDGIQVKHFTLWVSRDELVRRLRKRGDGDGSWPAMQIDRCMEGLSDDAFQHRVNTDTMPIESVVETIASLAGVDIRPDHRGPIGRKLSRITTQLRHIRLRRL